MWCLNNHWTPAGLHRQRCQELAMKHRLLAIPQYQIYLKHARTREASKKLSEDVDYWENIRSWHCRAFQVRCFQDFADKELRQRHEIEDALFIYMEKWRCLIICKGSQDDECFGILQDIYMAMETL